MLIDEAPAELTLSLQLYYYKANTAFSQTKSLLNTLIVNTVENGLITTVWAISNLVIYFVRTEDSINVSL